MDAAVPAFSRSNPRLPYQLIKNWPTVQISPPIQNAFRQSRHSGDFGLSSSTSFSYSRSVIFITPGLLCPQGKKYCVLPTLDIFHPVKYNSCVSNVLAKRKCFSCTATAIL